MNIVLFANGSSENHGCEAINKSTMHILGEHNYQIGTTNVHYEQAYDCVEYIPYTFKKKYSLLQRVLCRTKLNKHPKGKLQLAQFKTYFQTCDLALSVGGDNYCYGDCDWLYYLHDLAIAEGKKTVLWGASIEESLLDDRMLEDFKKFDKIIVRESISYQTLSKKGLTNVIQAPDPAFALPTVEPAVFDKGFSTEKKYVGLNISPLVERKEIKEGILRQNVCAVIDEILNTTSYDVLLIPHVVTSDNNDYELLRQIKELYPSERVIVIGDHPCEVLKYYISKCEMFIAARTHASIAAYSHCIPTLVIGYSVKSKGIAKDLFGDDKGYVLPINAIDSKSSLRDSFAKLFEKREEIREGLTQIMTNYIQQVKDLKNRLI